MGYYNHIIHLPYEFFASRRVGDIITRFQDALTIKDIFTTVSVSLILDIVLSLITGVILFHLNSSLFLILIVMIVVNVILIYVFKKPYKKLNYEQMESNAILNSHLIESMQNIETVKSQNDEMQQIHKLENRFVSLLKLGYKEGTLQNVQGVISSFINGIYGYWCNVYHRWKNEYWGLIGIPDIESIFYRAYTKLSIFAVNVSGSEYCNDKTE